MSRLRREFARISDGFTQWYERSRNRQQRYWVGVGIAMGVVWGQASKYQRFAVAEYGDHLVVTEYQVLKDNSRDFERIWNEHARITQKQEGYVSTKLFKVLNRDWPSDEELLGGARTPQLEGIKTQETNDQETNDQEIKNQEIVKEEASKPKKLETQENKDVPLTRTIEAPIENTPTSVAPDHRLPFQYLQMRHWKSPVAEAEWKENEKIKILLSQLEDICHAVQVQEYGTLVDDKIARAIY